MSISPANIFAIAPELKNGFPQTQTITFSADLITGNVITGSVASYSFSVPFNTNNATTLNDLCAALAIFPAVGSASNNGGHVVTVTGVQNGSSFILTASVAGGLTQATTSIATTVYPTAGNTTQAQVNNAINLAAGMMNVCTWGTLFDIGQTYLAAHLLTMTSSLGGNLGLANQKLGQESESYLQLNKPQDQAFYLTSYGTQYLALRDMLFITPIVGVGGLEPPAGSWAWWNGW